jgi:hypothetical protein
VQCHDGASAAPSIIMAFMLLKLNVPMEFSFSRLTSYRPKVKPNPSMMDGLKELETKLQQKRLDSQRCVGLYHTYPPE